MSDYANDESFLSPPGSSRTTSSPCKGALGGGGLCDVDDLDAWQKRLNEVMSDLKKARDIIKGEYEASDKQAFSKEESIAITNALALAQSVLNEFNSSAYVGKPNLKALKKAAGLAGMAFTFYFSERVSNQVEDISSMIHKAAVALDKLNSVKETVNAVIEDPYTPYQPKTPIGQWPASRMFLIGAGVIVGGSIVLGSVRGFRSVFPKV
jgi:hypothetical protein